MSRALLLLLASPRRRDASPRAAPPAFEIYDSAPDERAADAPEPAPAEAPDDSPAAFAAAAWDAEAGEAAAAASYVASCRAKLVSLYELYNPAKLDDVDDLLAKYAGREALLLSAVEGKYSGAGAIPLFKDEAAVMQGARLMEEYDARAREARAASAARLAAAAAARRAPRRRRRRAVGRRRAVAESLDTGDDAVLAALRGAVLEAAATNLDGAAALARAEFAWAAAARDGVDAALAAAFRDAAAEAYARDGPAAAAALARAAPAHRGNLPRLAATCAGAAPAETYDEVIRRLRSLGARAGAASRRWRRRASPPAATAEHLNGAMVRSVDRGPTADAMARLPEPGPPEVVLLGRSNVGKSSLANALLGRRALAPTSPVPGRTRRFHFYDVNSGDGAESERPRFALVDVPGARFAVSDVAAAEDGGLARPGVAEAAGGKQDSWRSLTARYLDVRDSLAVVLQLVDARRCLDGALPAADAATLDAVAGSRAADAARHVLVLTKVDKLKPRELDRAEATLRARGAAYAGAAARGRRPHRGDRAAARGARTLWREILAGLDAAS
ncbi:GTP binding protein [Aureococcus anophagefferens]|nr:GTP binding protein [Aureococcus anophagefferens]